MDDEDNWRGLNTLGQPPAGNIQYNDKGRPDNAAVKPFPTVVRYLIAILLVVGGLYGLFFSLLAAGFGAPIWLLILFFSSAFGWLFSAYRVATSRTWISSLRWVGIAVGLFFLVKIVWMSAMTNGPAK